MPERQRIKDQEELRIRLAVYKAKSRKPYNQIALETNISLNCMKKFTAGIRFLTSVNRDRLVTYLDEHETK